MAEERASRRRKLAGLHNPPGVTANGWLVTPHNIAFDPQGRLWVATDRANDFDIADGIYATATDGAGGAVTHFFFGCPTGAEMCGPCFTPDGKALFVSVQHPAEDSDSLDKPTTRCRISSTTCRRVLRSSPSRTRTASK